MSCTVCGAALPPGALFCGVCGSAVAERPAAAPRPAGSAEAEVAALPVPAAVAPTPPAAPDEHTRLPAARPQPAAARFVLQFSTGESVTVSGSGLIGRRPEAQPGEFFDTLVAIDDPGRSVSKTHLEFGQDGGTFWVSDRFSANGTVVREPERPARLSAPGMRSRVARGSRVEIGEQFFVVS
ncbi:zinc-ribbon domain-containing protein [Naasia aerilata]|uniref:FHA domain-containing protein n=1 Tax=Naasia aerilata TaxID=1162966 RepID=A0ABM8G7S0_9MICO|nr:zinc-ribbon domain-containing protein [Naasia aerilata]BDZ44178.1 hypothetical protein GCM10025866_00870 [Naasia aerilata]